jgi:hypothetical protein
MYTTSRYHVTRRQRLHSHENNTLANRNSAQGRDIYVKLSSLAAASMMRNNIVPAFPRIQWGNGAVHTPLNSFRAATGKGQGSLVTVPKFVSVAAPDFRLMPSSAAVDRGNGERSLLDVLSRYA